MSESDELRRRVRSLLHSRPGAQREFAAAIGMDESKLSKSLSGTRRFSPHELVRIAEYSGVTVNWLLNGRDDATTVTAVPAPTARSRSAPVEGPQSEARRRILETAWRLIARRGYHQVRISDIARELGTSNAAIHYYFPSKNDVLLEALRRNVKLAFDRQVAELHAIADARERLVRLVELQLPTPGVLHDEWSVWLQVWTESTLNPAVRELYNDAYDRWYQTISMTIRTGQRQGVFRKQDADELATRLSALIDGLGIQVLTGKRGCSVDHMRAHLHDFIERTIVEGRP
ncbi:TetR/AcrR family transcriptional regulator [Saccharomonospora azurea]|uniref:TetR/AcrR family transcriptional regulator n=1 Tax=Saccharomonospora azurea TaxID=40988 RepID=UPI0002F71A88|nr:TetR/AcrR family transcriptional regulator [Saccharomonospora azurea]